jgi:hypothetical protein
VNGFTAREVDCPRDYATKALGGHRFRKSGYGRLRADILQMWEAEAPPVLALHQDLSSWCRPRGVGAPPGH